MTKLNIAITFDTYYIKVCERSTMSETGTTHSFKDMIAKGIIKRNSAHFRS